MMASLGQRGAAMGWWLVSVALFVVLWEAGYLAGLYSADVLPPPSLFLGNFHEQAIHFDTGHRIVGQQRASSVWLGIMNTVAATVLRVLAGLGLGFVLGVATGVLVRYIGLFGKLVLPTLTLLAPISPFAWLPVAVFMLGVGNAPAIFLVFVAVYFIITLATIAEIDTVPHTMVQVARIMGADRRALYRHVVLPAILPGLFMILRMNLFAAWMVVLIAESAGTSHGLGAVIMLARNTANSDLVFLGFVVVGIVGFVFDGLLRIVQRRLLYWLPAEPAALKV